MVTARTLVAGLLWIAFALAAGCQNSYDLVVYGGTAGGAITAVSGARMGLKVALLDRRLREKDGVRKSGARVEAITMENGEQYSARIFADCTYEGDLMAHAGVSYTWGRESSAQYGESLAGVRGETPKHQFLVDL